MVRPGCYPGQPVFVASPGSSIEDEGVILSVVLDPQIGGSFVLVLDAWSLADGREQVPHHIQSGSPEVISCAPQLGGRPAKTILHAICGECAELRIIPQSFLSDPDHAPRGGAASLPPASGDLPQWSALRRREVNEPTSCSFPRRLGQQNQKRRAPSLAFPSPSGGDARGSVAAWKSQ